MRFMRASWVIAAILSATSASSLAASSLVTEVQEVQEGQEGQLNLQAALGEESTSSVAEEVASESLYGGPEVPFPLDAQLPFPWGTIAGTWEARGPGIDALFSFEVQADRNGRKILRVLHLEPATGKILAEGIGIGLDERNIVRAAMRGGCGAYMLYIGAFKNPKATQPKTVTVLTIRSFSGVEERDIQVIVRRVSNVTQKKPATPSGASKAIQP
jgi:hypothetical protein